MSCNIPTLPRTGSSWPAMVMQSYINPPTHSPCISPTIPRGRGWWQPLPGSAMVPDARKTAASSSLGGSSVGLNAPGQDWVLASSSLGRPSAGLCLSSCPQRLRLRWSRRLPCPQAHPPCYGRRVALLFRASSLFVRITNTTDIGLAPDLPY